jgi:poly(A) polymerase
MPEHALTRPAAPPSLKDAEWLKRPETKRVFAALSADGVETRAVGGAVRNTLLGLPVTEIDLATTALPEQVMALARKAGLKAIPTGIEHGTVTVVVDGAPFEVTTLRRDVETYGRHATVAFTEDWEEDARRRDFTLNALYAGSDGTVFDPLGGYADLVAGRVRFIGEAEARIKEDYLRILRFFRFNAYYGKGPLDPEGLQASVRLRAGLDQLSA